MRIDFPLKLEKTAFDLPWNQKNTPTDEGTNVDLTSDSTSSTTQLNIEKALGNAANALINAYNFMDKYQKLYQKQKQMFDDIKKNSLVTDTEKPLNGEDPCAISKAFGGAQVKFSEQDLNTVITGLQKYFLQYSDKFQAVMAAFDNFLKVYNDNANQTITESKSIKDIISTIGLKNNSTPPNVKSGSYIFRLAQGDNSDNSSNNNSDNSGNSDKNNSAQNAKVQPAPKKTVAELFSEVVNLSQETLSQQKQEFDIYKRNATVDPQRFILLFGVQKKFLLYMQELCQTKLNYDKVSRLSTTLNMPGLGIMEPAREYAEGLNDGARYLIYMAKLILDSQKDPDDKAWAAQFYNAAGQMSNKAQEIYLEAVHKVSPIL
jgi:hypothetical protein